MRGLALVFVVACGGGGHPPEPAPVPSVPAARPDDAAVPDAAVVVEAEPAVKPAGRLATAKAALAAYRSMWDATIGPYLVRKAPSNAEYNATVHAAQVTATRMPCREQHARIVDTIGPKSTDGVIFGQLANLARAGTCWLVDARINPFTNLWGYLDAQTGELLVIWHTIEG